jgi:REP element-mobilizing transposase RayT
VELVAFVFMGNHFHILVRLHEDQLPDIMRDFKGGVAKALNRLHGRRGALWMEELVIDALGAELPEAVSARMESRLAHGE